MRCLSQFCVLIQQAASKLLLLFAATCPCLRAYRMSLQLAEIDGWQTACINMQVTQANLSVEREVRGTADDASAPSAAGVHEQLLAQTAMCEQFIALLCQFERGAVLPFLQSHDSYRCYYHLPSCCLQQDVCTCQVDYWLQLADMTSEQSFYNPFDNTLIHSLFTSLPARPKTS